MFELNSRGLHAGIVLAVSAGILMVTRTAVAALNQVPVLLGTPNQIMPAAAGMTLAWSRNGPSDTGRYNEYVRASDGVVRVNGRGTQGFGGGISGTTLVYQRVRNGHSIIRFYDIARHTYAAPPAGWNTAAWEFAPTVSGNLVLFGRISGSGAGFTERAFLGDRTTGR